MGVFIYTKMTNDMIEPSLDVIVAADQKFGYGKNGLLPWHGKLPNEYNYFLTMVKDHAVIFGKNSWVKDREEKPIDHTFSAVVSRSLKKVDDNDQFSVSENFSKAIDSCIQKGFKRIFIS